MPTPSVLSRRLPPQLSAEALHEPPLPPGTLDLAESNPTRCGFAYPPLDPALFDPLAGPYVAAPLGPWHAREALAERLAAWGRPTHPSRLMLTASTSEAFSYLFKLALDPGALVATSLPGYPLVPHLAELEGLRTCTFDWHQDATGAWRLDLDSVQRALVAGAAAVVLVSPNNPTGACLSEAELAALAVLCNRHGAWAILDEVFAPYRRTAPHARLHPLGAFERAASLGGLSKAALLPQAKISWIDVHGAPGPVAAAMAGLEWLGDAYLSLGVGARALPELLVLAEAMQAQARARIAEGDAIARAALMRSGVGTLMPAEAGWYAVAHIDAAAPGWQAARGARGGLSGWLLREAGVHLHPGYLYDLPGERVLVAALLQPPAEQARGWARVADALAAGGGDCTGTGAPI